MDADSLRTRSDAFRMGVDSFRMHLNTRASDVAAAAASLNRRTGWQAC
jgi:hypothetical protein